MVFYTFYMKSKGLQPPTVSEMTRLRIQIPEDMYIAALSSASDEGITLEEKLREIVMEHVSKQKKKSNTHTEKR